MAAGTGSSAMVNGTDASTKALEMAIDLPHSPGLKLNLHLTILPNSVMLFLTSTSSDSAQSAVSMGSFVYALSDRYNPTQPMSTALYTSPSSQDFTTRMAKVLTRRLKKPCYVGSSINLASAAGGGSVDEEMEAFRYVVDTVITATS
ncbi:Putative proteasome assembly chaperone 4 [Septoria linicola]|uniref:Proteasome assembly chaperone 4 n=1 Tax=Septoria linicola TaxID=215465 RepID=A0A9Q9EGY8_9PEZI|nr:putative proteasome assembly chaperone 4 [Septoria linicola]USW49424.1 Putative proteasome assembly chaperone 4 [Septoria linicola]